MTLGQELARQTEPEICETVVQHQHVVAVDIEKTLNYVGSA